jgi:DNA anti-recombination protein RmuC
MQDTAMTDPALTVDTSLGALIEAVAKAAEDLRAVGATLERARADIMSHNTTVQRGVITAATRAVDHLRQSDEALRDVLRALEARD